MNPQAPSSYTPVPTGGTPTLGSSGPAVSTLQTNYNAANPTATPLKVDGLYGPLTNAALNPVKNNLVVSAGPATTTFNTHSANLDSMLANLNQVKAPTTNTSTVNNTNDSYTQLLDRMSSNSDLATKALINTIQAQRSQQGATVNAQYDNYKRGLQALGIQHNSAQFTPDLLQGHIQQAENEHQQKLQSLDVAMNKALVDAQTAKDNKDLTTLNAKMAYIKDLNAQKQTYLKNIADQMTAGNTIASNLVAPVYDGLQKLSPADQETYLQTVAQKYGISLGSLVSAVAKEKTTRETADYTSKNQKLTIAGKQLSNAKAAKDLKAATDNFSGFKSKPAAGDISKVNQYLAAHNATQSSYDAIANESNFYKVLAAANKDIYSTGYVEPDATSTDNTTQ